MNERILSFIEDNQTLTLCTSLNNTPQCSCCFYSFFRKNNWLIIKSDRKTEHIEIALQNDMVAGTIIPSVSKIGTIRGIQFKGKFIEPESNNNLNEINICYYKRFPAGMAIPGNLWIIELDYIKMTDNTLGFGKKIIWEKP